MSRGSIEGSPQSKRCRPTHLATQQRTTFLAKRVVVWSPTGRVDVTSVCLERQNCVGRIWGSESNGHIYQVTGRGPCWAGRPRTTPFSLCARTQHACDGLDSKPARDKLQRSAGSGVLCNAALYESGNREGGSLQHRRHDKPLERMHAGLTGITPESRPTIIGRTAHGSRSCLEATPADTTRGRTHRDFYSHTTIHTS